MSKVLIVEDDRNTLFGLVEILTQEGYEVEGAESAKQAINNLQKDRFDILLTDLFAGCWGPARCRWLRARYILRLALRHRYASDRTIIRTRLLTNTS